MNLILVVCLFWVRNYFGIWSYYDIEDDEDNIDVININNGYNS